PARYVLVRRTRPDGYVRLASAIVALGWHGSRDSSVRESGFRVGESEGGLTSRAAGPPGQLSGMMNNDGTELCLELNCCQLTTCRSENATRVIGPTPPFLGFRLIVVREE